MGSLLSYPTLSATAKVFFQQGDAKAGPEKQTAPSSLLPPSFPSLLCCAVVALGTCWVPLPPGLARGCSNSAKKQAFGRCLCWTRQMSRCLCERW